MGLITAAGVVAEVLPNRNIDENLLEDSIPIAELKYIKKLLGKDLYNLIVSENTSQVFTGLNQTLLDNHLKRILSRYVVYEAMPMIKAEITSNGINVPNIDFNLPVDDTGFAMLRNKMLSDAELLVAEMREYLNDNSSSFPLFNCDQNISDKTLPYLY